MNDSVDLLQQEAHFAFGKNWASYANLVTEAEIADAVAGLRRLAGGALQGKRFLDIGCGSGLHALAALRLGASEVLALDIDPDSVATTRRVLELHAPNQPWRVMQKSIFDTDAGSVGQYHVVYSWGVLHHTGDMYGALRRASALVAPDGQFIFALYRHTRLCWFWKQEKRWYAKAGKRAQRLAQLVFTTAFRIVYPIANRASFRSYVESYAARNRGMEFHHDVHDWMGGWPYESISPQQVEALMQELGLAHLRAFAHQGTPLGLFGSGCDEFAYARR